MRQRVRVPDLDFLANRQHCFAWNMFVRINHGNTKISIICDQKFIGLMHAHELVTGTQSATRKPIPPFCGGAQLPFWQRTFSERAACWVDSGVPKENQTQIKLPDLCGMNRCKLSLQRETTSRRHSCSRFQTAHLVQKKQECIADVAMQAVVFWEARGFLVCSCEMIVCLNNNRRRNLQRKRLRKHLCQRNCSTKRKIAFGERSVFHVSTPFQNLQQSRCTCHISCLLSKCLGGGCWRAEPTLGIRLCRAAWGSEFPVQPVRCEAAEKRITCFFSWRFMAFEIGWDNNVNRVLSPSRDSARMSAPCHSHMQFRKGMAHTGSWISSHTTPKPCCCCSQWCVTFEVDVVLLFVWCFACTGRHAVWHWCSCQIQPLPSLDRWGPTWACPWGWSGSCASAEPLDLLVSSWGGGGSMGTNARPLPPAQRSWGPGAGRSCASIEYRALLNVRCRVFMPAARRNAIAMVLFWSWWCCSVCVYGPIILLGGGEYFFPGPKQQTFLFLLCGLCNKIQLFTKLLCLLYTHCSSKQASLAARAYCFPQRSLYLRRGPQKNLPLPVVKPLVYLQTWFVAGGQPQPVCWNNACCDHKVCWMVARAPSSQTHARKMAKCTRSICSLPFSSRQHLSIVLVWLFSQPCLRLTIRISRKQQEQVTCVMPLLLGDISIVLIALWGQGLCVFKGQQCAGNRKLSSLMKTAETSCLDFRAVSRFWSPH